MYIICIYVDTCEYVSKCSMCILPLPSLLAVVQEFSQVPQISNLAICKNYS